ncbi:MAG TPA: Rieske 2Fe-2S domain-containing protein [Polyangiaceae bacterium]|nr:Rieske 2Fe-2S domain-containing protein [Polyangiaceae bacterium]
MPPPPPPAPPPAPPARWRALPFAPAPGTPLAPLDELDEGAARAFVFGEGKHAFRMFVVRRGGRVRGYVNRCPHLSLPLDYRPGQFLTHDRERILCSMHYAVFRVDDGLCVEGACEGLSLDPVPVAVVGGVLCVAPPEPDP